MKQKSPQKTLVQFSDQWGGPWLRQTLGIILIAQVLLRSAMIYGQTQASMRVSWTPYPGAYYYDGYFETNGEPVLFRTSSHWIIVPTDTKSHISLDARDLTGALLGPIDLNIKGLGASSEQMDLATNQTQDPKPAIHPVEGAAAEDSHNEGSDSPDSQGFTTERTYDEALNFLDLEDPYAPSESKVRAQKALIPYQRPEVIRAEVRLGFGQEKLSSSSGISYYSGASSLGSTELRGEWLRQEGWYASFRVEMHSFETVKTKSAGDGTKTNEAFERLGMDLRLGYDVAFRENLVIVPHLGYYQIKAPILKDPEESGVTRFKNQDFRTLGLGVKAQGVMLKNHGAEASVFAFPLFAQSDVKGYIADVVYRYGLNSRWDLSSAFQWSLNQPTVRITCPSLEECQENSKTTVMTKLWFAGLGYHF